MKIEKPVEVIKEVLPGFSVIAFKGATAPSGWQLCDGQGKVKNMGLGFSSWLDDPSQLEY